MRGIGTVDGESVETPIEEVEVRFPRITQIMNSSEFISMANSAWAATLADCCPTNRRERGFWIILNTETSLYEAGETKIGPDCPSYAQATVNLSPRPPDDPPLPSPTASGACYPVASFHCHTPTTYLVATTNYEGRAVGVSGKDWQMDTIEQVPGIVYDYLDSPEGSGNIPPEHPINSPAGIYESIHYERRPTP